jgi:putative ABC transport system permease protein
MDTIRETMHFLFTLPLFLAVKELWRNRGRFLLVSLVIALITVLVLFIAALGEGLGTGNREYLSKLDADLLVYQARSDLLIGVSRLDLGRLNNVRSLEGVADAGALATASISLVLPNTPQPFKVAMLGVQPGRPGEPVVTEGRQLVSETAREAIIDLNVVRRTAIRLGDTITLRVTQGTQDQFFSLRVVGVTDGQQYSLQPSIIVPFLTWDRIRPKSEAEINRTDSIFNVMVVRLLPGTNVEAVRQQIESRVNKVEAATIAEAITAVPGYSAQQNTINTQGVFTLLIGVLVIGGFFQIQMLQKVPQVGVLKAIGAPNGMVAGAAILQIMLVTVLGVGLGGLGVYLLSLGFPPSVPIVFNGPTTVFAVLALLFIGPIGGLVSVSYATRIEPLKALGLTN